MNLPYTIHNSLRYILFLLLIVFANPTYLYAEGTDELNPLGWGGGNIVVLNTSNPNTQSRFATFDCDPLVRLNIRVSAGDIIYYGFGGLSNNDIRVRLRDEAGNVLVPSTQITTIAGYVGNSNNANFDRIVSGPIPLVGATGYTPSVYVVDPLLPASEDFFIEFQRNGVDHTTTFSSFSIDLFDITVVNSGGIEQPGRVWSREWSLSTGSGGNRVNGDMFVYTADRDSVVTRVSFNGMQPFGYAISCNPTGVSNTGNAAVDRRSVYANATNPAGPQTYPFYPIFLNNPDQIEFPSGVVGCLTASALDQCEPGAFCINVVTQGGGTVDILLDLNGISGYQLGSADVLIPSFDVSDGTTCIPWDGNDGFGMTVPPGTDVPIRISFFTGLTHLPIHDVETHSNGFSVALVRPLDNICGGTFETPRLYWDDSNINTGNALDGLVNLAGCQPVLPPPPPTVGCHRFNNRGANSNPETINTWWFVNEQEAVLQVPIEDPTFGIISSVDNAGDCGYQDGDIVTVDITFSTRLYSAAQLTYNITPTTPNIILTQIGYDSTDIDVINEIQTVSLQYEIGTAPPGATINNLIFTFEVIAVPDFCSNPQQSEREIDCNILLPVQFIKFTGKREEGESILYWETAYEIDNQGFEVERSTDAINFEKIAFVATQGASNRKKHYYYTDYEANSAILYYYRLKQVNRDGSYTYSNIIVLQGEEAKVQDWESVVIYPNPIDNGNFYINYQGKGQAKITLFNTTGQEVFYSVVNKEEGKPLQLNIGNQAKGMYLLRIQTPIKTYVEKVIYR